MAVVDQAIAELVLENATRVELRESSSDVHVLWLGNRRIAENAQALQLLQATHVVNMASSQVDCVLRDVGVEGRPPVRYLCREMDDRPGAMDLAQARSCLEAACTFIDAAFAANPKAVVYLHCAGGVSRSATAALAFLVTKRGRSLRDAYSQLLELRPVIGPNADFFGLLLDLERETHGQETMERPLNPQQRHFTPVKKPTHDVETSSAGAACEPPGPVKKPSPVRQQSGKGPEHPRVKGGGKGPAPKGKGKGHGSAASGPEACIATAAKPCKSMEEIMAERRVRSAEGECSNTDAVRSLIRKESHAALWLGNQEDAGNADALRRDGVTHILNCASDVPPPAHVGEFQYMHILLRDSPDAAPRLSEELLSGKALHFIEAGMQLGGVLVHCRLGRSRSASFVIAFLVTHRGCSYEEALAEVKSRRQLYGGSLVEPNAGFKEALRVFCEAQQTLNALPRRDR